MTSAPIPMPAEITATYARISDTDFDDELGVIRQRKDAAHYAERLGLPVVEFDDNRRSASRYARRKRPAFEQMLRRIEAGEIRHLVFYDLSRLTREPKVMEALIDLAETGTVEIHSVTGRIDLRDPDGRAMARVVTAMNAKSSDDTSKRIRRQQEQAREAGRYHGGGRPFGFEPAGGLVRESEAELIREAANRVLRGDGLLTIAKSWNARGLTAPLGGAFRPKTVRDSVLRPLAVERGILSSEVQEQVRAIVMDPRRRKAASTARTHLLSGLLRCGRCGGTMRSKPRNDGKSAYSCDGCHLSRLSDPVDTLIAEAVLYRLDTPALARPEDQADDATRQLTDALEAFQGRLEELETGFVDGDIDLPSFKRMKSSLEARIAETRATLARRAGKRVLAAIPTDARAWWPDATLDQKRAVISELIAEIKVLPADRGRRDFDPSKVLVRFTF